MMKLKEEKLLLKYYIINVTIFAHAHEANE